MIAAIFENLLVMFLTIVVLLGGFYLLLLLLNVWLKIKTGSREQEGLSNLYASSMKELSKGNSSRIDSPDEQG